MAYYVMNEHSELMERLEIRPTESDLYELANDCGCDELWVIEGQHSGIVWVRPAPQIKPTSKPRLVFGEPIPPELNPHATQPRIKGL